MTEKSGFQEAFLKYFILTLILVLAFSLRLVSVFRYESVIHEFDPYFNYRSTIRLLEEGFYSFIDWFDELTWYPLGRVVGGTVFPGIMMTASSLWLFAQKVLRVTLNIRDVCVFMGPFFASLASLVSYLLTTEVSGSAGAGLISALTIGIVPAYISRSVAGSFDNECIAIFALILTFYLWVKAVKTGSQMFASLTAISYFYMVLSWGGYVFIINLIPLHVMVLVLIGRYTKQLYVVYSTFYVLGTVLAMQVPVINFQVIRSSEHLASLAVFVGIQLIALVSAIRAVTSKSQFKTILKFGITALSLAIGIFLVVGLATGMISPWTGRFATLLDPTYAKKHSPIIASVAEHQPTAWASFFFDLQWLVFFFPVGLYFIFENLSDGNIFLILYAITSVYFVGVMVRLMLVLAPIASIMSSIAIARFLDLISKRAESPREKLLAQLGKKEEEVEDKSDEALREMLRKKKEKFKSSNVKTKKELLRIPQWAALILMLLMAVILASFVIHSIWVTESAYSSPSIVLAGKTPSGSRYNFDDFREAYYWLRMNTPEDARIMAWWDYGYQITGMANRTVLVDNNTWNFTHIAQVGRALVKPEEESVKIMDELDVDYVLVVFGGLLGYSSDDVNKNLWIVRIAGTIDPTINEADYLGAYGDYRVDQYGGKALRNSFLYKLSYYRFGEVSLDPTQPAGVDRARNQVAADLNIKLDYVEEVFTSEHWMVRIYRRKK